MAETIRVSHEQELTGGGILRTVVYRLPSGKQHRIWWDVTAPHRLLPSEPANNDLALTSILFLAMSRGLAIHVEGKVSRSLLEKAELFMAIWSLWRPDLYKCVQITADEECADRDPDPLRQSLAVCAFSAGVDASCTALRHVKKLAGRSSRDLLVGVLIQGFDLGLDEDIAFEVTERTARTMLDDLGVPLVAVRTNWRAEVCNDWEMEFGLGVLTCLKLWENEVGTLLVGSCGDYSRLVVPWGSHPLATTLLASGDVRVLYDGGELSRTQKMEILSGWPSGYDNLRVCWQGEVPGANCGRCEKCIRTKLSAIVTGQPLPRCLRDRPTPRQVSRVGPLKTAQRTRWLQMIDEATTRGFVDPLINAAKVTVRRRKAPLDVRLRGKLSRLLKRTN